MRCSDLFETFTVSIHWSFIVNLPGLGQINTCQSRGLQGKIHCLPALSLGHLNHHVPLILPYLCHGGCSVAVVQE